jgi:hypothetical protein
MEKEVEIWTKSRMLGHKREKKAHGCKASDQIPLGIVI